MLRGSVALAARLFDWRNALVSLRPETFITGHREGFGCSGGRNPNQSKDPGFQLIGAAARDNLTWAETYIAAEHLVKLGITVSFAKT